MLFGEFGPLCPGTEVFSGEYIIPDMGSKKYPTILTIAGSDSIGGAGIQADIKTVSSIGVYAMSAITAVTAQNTLGVVGLQAVSDELLKAQLEAVAEDVRPDAVKIGMIPSVSAVKIIAEFLRKYSLSNVVLDPVCISTSGNALCEAGVPAALADYLFKEVTLVTPNLPESGYYLQRDIVTDDIENIASQFVDKTGCKAVLIKGGHNQQSDKAIDILLIDGKFHRFETHKIESKNTHGTGCCLSSAIAANLALGFDMPAAVKRAKDWLTDAIQLGKDYTFGKGHGPLNFFITNK